VVLEQLAAWQLASRQGTHARESVGPHASHASREQLRQTTPRAGSRHAHPAPSTRPQSRHMLTAAMQTARAVQRPPSLSLSAHAEAATCLAPSLLRSPSPSRPVSAHTEAATCAMPGEDEDESLAKRLRGCLIRCSGKIVY
jgi:hypothetical protein